MAVEVETPKAEVVEQTPKEDVKPTETKEKPTVRTFTEEDFRHELDIALGKSNKTLNQQIATEKQVAATAKAEADAAKAESNARLEQINALMKEVDEALEDDPERKQAYTSRRAILERELKIAEREVAATKKEAAATQKERELTMAVRAKELMEETGVPLEEIQSCESEPEMELKALRYQVNHPKAKEEEPKFDSAIPTGGGLTDDEFERKFGTGELDITPENLKRAKDIMEKRLKGG